MISSALRSIPLVDISSTTDTTHEIEKASRDIGFMYIAGHGIFPETFAQEQPESAGFGIHPHKDTAALTMLAPDPVAGLMVRCRDDQEWIRAEPPGDALTVNIGDLLELWSGGYFVSTPHKVVNTSGAERYSFPYFVVPRFDTVVRPLRTPQPAFRRSSVHVGDVSKEVWRTNWSDVTTVKPHFDLGTLEN